MSDYIKREDALDIVADNNVTGEITLNRYDKIIDGIYEIPSADVAPIVRCRDCRWWNDGTQMCGITISATPYGHCHDGETWEEAERKDNE